jgi:hypothetical protein
MRALFLLVVLFSTVISSYSFAHLDKLKRMDHSRHDHMNDKAAISPCVRIVITSAQKMTFEDLGYKPVRWLF